MTIEKLRDFSLSLKGTSEHLPFDDNVLVFKVADKMFCLTNLSSGDSMNVKCNPELAIELRERFQCVTPGYHMNKKHWNTIAFSSEMQDDEMLELVKHSYELVFNKLTKKQKQEVMDGIYG